MADFKQKVLVFGDTKTGIEERLQQHWEVKECFDKADVKECFDKIDSVASLIFSANGADDEILEVAKDIKENENTKHKTVLIWVNDENETDFSTIIKNSKANDVFKVGQQEELIVRLKYLLEKKGKVSFADTKKKEDLPPIPLDKRLLDILVSGGALLALSPVFLVVSIILKATSKGPVFFYSKRVGRGYQIFELIKFRTMVPNADQMKDKISHLNQYKTEDGQIYCNGKECNIESNPCSQVLYADGEMVCEKLHNARKGGEIFNKFQSDPRVSKFGKFLRKTSIDELPQLINILKGDMSLVGIRPLPLYEAEKLTRGDMAERFMGPAGLTGLWQVRKRGRAEMSSEERIALDNEYAQKYSFWYDIKIMLETIPALFKQGEV